MKIFEELRVDFCNYYCPVKAKNKDCNFACRFKRLIFEAEAKAKAAIERLTISSTICHDCDDDHCNHCKAAIEEKIYNKALEDVEKELFEEGDR